MENKISLKENLDSLLSNLEKFLKTETVIGEPITVGETTLIPIISVSFGCGTGGGTGDDNAKHMGGSGSGAGLGAKITPNAVLVIKKDEVSMLPVKSKSNLDSLVKMVPEIVKKFNLKKDNCCESEDNKAE